MFLWVSVRHVGAHPGGHQHGVSIQISINLRETFLRISRIRNIRLTWILARNLVYLPPFIHHIPDFIYWTVLILILIYSECLSGMKKYTGTNYISGIWLCVLFGRGITARSQPHPQAVFSFSDMAVAGENTQPRSQNSLLPVPTSRRENLETRLTPPYWKTRRPWGRGCARS